MVGLCIVYIYYKLPKLWIKNIDLSTELVLVWNESYGKTNNNNNKIFVIRAYAYLGAYIFNYGLFCYCESSTFNEN